MTARCEGRRPELAELALGTLDGRDRATLLAHVQTCPACEAELDELSALADQLLEVAPEAEPPVGFETALFDRLRAEEGAGPVARPWPAGRGRAGPGWPWPPWWWPWPSPVGGSPTGRSPAAGPGQSALPAVTTADLVGPGPGGHGDRRRRVARVAGHEGGRRGRLGRGGL